MIGMTSVLHLLCSRYLYVWSIFPYNLFLLFVAAIAELLDNAVDEVCSIHLNLSCISLKIS